MLFINTFISTCSRCYETVQCTSLCRLSVPALAHSSKPTAASLLLWAREAGDISRLLQQRWWANGMQAVPHCQHTCVVEHRLFSSAVLVSDWFSAADYWIHTHSFNGPLSWTTRVSRYQKGKSNLDFTEARDSEWQWHQLGHMQVCTSLLTDNHASTQPLSFLQARCPFCRPTNSVKTLMAADYWIVYILKMLWKPHFEAFGNLLL